MSTDAITFFQDLDGGTFAAKVGISITNAGRGALTAGGCASVETLLGTFQ